MIDNTPGRNGKAFPGGVDGRVFRGIGGALLTLEPTNRGDRAVQLWAYVHGEELAGMSLIPREVRGLLADLSRRADVIDPPAGGVATAPAPARAVEVLDDMRTLAATLTAVRQGDLVAGRVRGWIAALEPDLQKVAAVIAAAAAVSTAAHRHRTDAELGPAMSLALRDLDAALALDPEQP